MRQRQESISKAPFKFGGWERGWKKGVQCPSSYFKPWHKTFLFNLKKKIINLLSFRILEAITKQLLNIVSRFPKNP